MRLRFLATSSVFVLLTISYGAAQQPTAQPQPITLPKDAVRLEGVPRVRIDDTADGSRRRTLDGKEADAHQVSIQVKDGQFFRAGVPATPLKVDAQGAYTYLSSKPGSYIRLTQLNDRISYVEHLDEGPNHVTFWGELRVVLGRNK